MRSIDTAPTEAGEVPAAVYLLQRHDGQRFKIGWSVEPIVRIKRLPEFIADELDLVGSHVAWLPSLLRAQQVERALHRGLATHRAMTPHHLDGYTEWFRPQAHRTAIHMLRHMPMGGQASQSLALLPFMSDSQVALACEPVNSDSAVLLSAQDRLWAIEDLLLRAAAAAPVVVECAGERRVLRLVDFRGPRARLPDAVRWALVDIDTYRWQAGDRSGSFVQLMDYERDDLVILLAPARTVRHWADGALTWQVLALLERLRGVAAYRRSASSLAGCRS